MSDLSKSLTRLGLIDYATYLESPTWFRFRDGYMMRHAARCAVCKAGAIELHHKTYVRLGCERDSDIVPLCATHHKAVHLWLCARKLQVTHTPEALRHLKEVCKPLALDESKRVEYALALVEEMRQMRNYFPRLELWRGASWLRVPTGWLALERKMREARRQAAIARKT